MKRKVIGKRERRGDLEVHVSEVTADGNRYVEIREYIPSLDVYGRGVLLPVDMRDWLRDELGRVK